MTICDNDNFSKRLIRLDGMGIVVLVHVKTAQLKKLII